ncbi:hypothetical protein HPB47_010433 [Ixodes persulcatus]|uniref:Uncharacterized protein n=1 Tax=Ixodes persulcatus TaxID=34615 RepID=A0AC60NZB6_IXOPE|nr:hypothetical protein HPB47_010433 [Ixodes persulcatus]
MAKATPADVPAVAAGTRRRASRTSVRQFEVLLDYIEKNPCMVSSRIPTSSAERERHWQVLTERLNSDLMSVPKEKDKWKKTWFDWKCNVRTKARGSAGKKSLSPLEERLVAVTGLLDGSDDSGQAHRKGGGRPLVYPYKPERPTQGSQGTFDGVPFDRRTRGTHSPPKATSAGPKAKLTEIALEASVLEADVVPVPSKMIRRAGDFRVGAEAPRSRQMGRRAPPSPFVAGAVLSSIPPYRPGTSQQLPGKRKRVVLTIRQKLEIIRLLEAGRMPKELAGEFGIGEQTVRDLRKSKEQLKHFSEESGDASGRLKSMKLPLYRVLDRALRTWLQERRKLGEAVTTPPVRMLPTGHSPDNASMHVEATYGENHGEFIIPMSDVAEQQLIARPSTAPRDAAHSMVLSDVRSLVTAPPEIQIKEEVPDRDGTVENPDNSNEGDVIEDVAAPALPAASPLPSPPVLHVVPQTVATPPPTATNGPFFAKNRNRRPAPYASSTQDRKSRLEIEVLLATKRKLEAEERRANAEAEFYLEEKRRSTALVSLHQEERRKLSAITELHVEERRKASSKADLLQEHRNYYLEQQRTEVVRRRLLLLEIQKVKKELKGQR